jgi:RNA polymerase sigma-70 factor (ECF subfamily)
MPVTLDAGGIADISRDFTKSGVSCEGFREPATIFFRERKNHLKPPLMQNDARVCRELSWRASVLAGDEGAWRAWYDEAYEPLCAFVFWRMGRQSAGVDEVVQETWLIAVRRIKDFDPRQGSFVDWLRGIAGNLVRNHSRQRQTANTAMETIAAGTAQAAKAEPPVEAAERSARVAAALLALPEHYAAVLQAKYLEQRSVSEIATAWNQTAKAIESLLTRARLAFREQFGEES